MEVKHGSDWTMLNGVEPEQHGDHSQHMQHGNRSGECIMAMSWNTNTRDVCIITPAWHIRSSGDFVLTMLVIFGISVSYEYLKWIIRCIDMAIARLDDAQSSQCNRTLGDGEADMNSAAAASRRPRSNNTRRLIPLTYDDLLASESNSQRSFGDDSDALRKTNRASHSSIFRLMYETDIDTALMQCKHLRVCTV